MIDIIVKTYSELAKDELYTILKLRAEIFIVEQDCAYQDIDDKDQKAIHVLGYKKSQLVAYTRIFKSYNYFKYASIGRVLVIKKERQYKYGKIIMKASIQAIKNYFNETIIQLSAQTYLTRFYNDLGFVEEGESYLEDGIPHILMIKR